MVNNMDNAKQTETNEKQPDGKIPITSMGWVCVYCGTETEDGCCGEIHHEIGYETDDGELILESELTQHHEIIEE